MTSGEKRSLTSSLNKFSVSFIEENDGVFLSFKDSKEFINSFYDYWIENSMKSKLAWCKNNEHFKNNNFKEEMFTKIKDIFIDEIKVLDKRNTLKVLPPLRSKKKRLRKKREKQTLLLV